MACTVFYVFDDEPTELQDWTDCDDGETVRVLPFDDVDALVRSVQTGRPDVVVLDYIDRDVPIELDTLRSVLRAGVPSAVLFTNHSDQAIDRIAGDVRVVVAAKQGEGDATPADYVIERMKLQPLTYLGLRFAQYVRELTANLVETGAMLESGEPNPIVSAMAAKLTAEDQEGDLIRVFARNALGEYMRPAPALDAQPQDIYRLRPAQQVCSFGNVVRDTETGKEWVLLSPVCEMHGHNRLPPVGVLAFLCRSPEDLVAELTREWARLGDDEGARREAIDLHANDARCPINDRQRVLREVCRHLPQTERMAKLQANVASRVAADGQEWCYVLPRPSDDPPWIVDFAYPTRIASAELSGGSWRVVATIEETWASHMLHKFSRWAGRLGVQDIDNGASCQAIAAALQGLADEVNPPR